MQACNAFLILRMMYVVAWGSDGPLDASNGDGQELGSIGLSDATLSLLFSFGAHCECKSVSSALKLL